MRSLIVVTVICLTSTPAFACVFHTDCNPGATCVAGVCSDQRGSHNDNDDPPSISTHDNATLKRGKTCYYDSDCSRGRCIKGSGMKGVCIGQ
jgi:hypothetical protein